jgi:hypothetical protein
MSGKPSNRTPEFLVLAEPQIKVKVASYCSPVDVDVVLYMYDHGSATRTVLVFQPKHFWALVVSYAKTSPCVLLRTRLIHV